MTYKFIFGNVEIEYDVGWGISLWYDEALNLLHPEITWKHLWIGDYEGDIISIGYDKHDNWYYKNNSYGSCSGCDWAQSIKNEEEAIEFLKAQCYIIKFCCGDVLKKYLKKEINNCWELEETHLEQLFNFIDAKKDDN